MRLRDYFWTQGEPWRSIRTYVVPRILRAAHSSLMCTLRITTTGVHQCRPYIDQPAPVGTLIVLWHDHTFLPLHLFRGRNICVMMSTSRAGRMQSAFWGLYGWPTVWGSTKKREGIQALREVLRNVKNGQTFGFTPDGPKGPRHYTHPGVVFLSSKSGASVLPLGVACTRYWQLPTWDRYLIPKPFSRVHIHIGPELFIPPDLNKTETEAWRRIVETSLNEANTEAERILRTS